MRPLPFGLTEEQLALHDYKAQPERVIVFKVKASDWNCPQHITPRYTAEEVEAALEPQRAYIRELEERVQELEEGRG